jgi:hypothetical protein
LINSRLHFFSTHSDESKTQETDKTVMWKII